MSEATPFDSQGNVTYLRRDRQGGEPPGTDPLEARVAKLETDITDIKVTLGRIDERLAGMATSLATKADVAELKGELRGKLGLWQFISVMGGAVALILSWPNVVRLFGG